MNDPRRQMVASFSITLKNSAIQTAGVTIEANTQAERDRAFAVVRKLMPEARHIKLLCVAPAEEARS